MPRDVTVLTASERPEVHATIEKALALLGEQDAARVSLLRADNAAATLTLASVERPRVAFLDVTIGHNAGVGLVHFLQTTVPGIVVIAVVPNDVDRGGADVRLVEQAASLGAAYVLLGELTGDDVLRAFTKVAPAYATSGLPAISASNPSNTSPLAEGAALLGDVRGFQELDARLGELAAAFERRATPGDLRAHFLTELRRVLESCVAQERADRATMQDLHSSAYSFAYFVDLAGREIDLARRHGRRFALATVDVAQGALDAFDTRAAVELVLGAVRDTDVVARADERELLLLLPETGSKGARTLRRRIFDRLRAAAPQLATQPPPLRIGIATFPFDGEDLSRLLRIARRRAERWSSLDPPAATSALLANAIGYLAAAPSHGPYPPFGGLVPIDLPLRDAWALLETLVRESTRAGDAIIGLHVPHEETQLGLAQGLRAATAAYSSEMTTPSASGAVRGSGLDREARMSLMTGTTSLVRGAPFEEIEVAGILAEHGSYGLVGRVREGHLLALQTHELPLVEALLNGLEQPMLRRGSVSGSDRASSSSTPISALRSSRSEPALRR